MRNTALAVYPLGPQPEKPGTAQQHATPTISTELIFMSIFLSQKEHARHSHYWPF
jgi:hypothetical protein